MRFYNKELENGERERVRLEYKEWHIYAHRNGSTTISERIIINITIDALAKFDDMKRIQMRGKKLFLIEFPINLTLF